MEIEKIRETSWKIQLKDQKENIEITSVEISGEVRRIKLALMNSDNSVKVKMNKDEFFNFLSLILAFKDVVIGEETLILEEELNLTEDGQKEVEEQISNTKDNLFQMPSDSIEKNLENNDNGELNPEEWDPW
ncbi:MAG: hypothetical protein KAW51_00940 [Candidatus Lokiarchaeota archaeon]|nr:hypothetical protein [Candidatus Lokiarchaeota archaeon]